MKRQYLVVVVLAIVAGSCAANEESTSQAPAPGPREPVSAPSASDAAPATEALALALPSIASARLSQDCPDPSSELAVNSATPEKRKGKSDRAGSGLVQPCSQSSVQLAFTGQGASSAKVQLEQVRLLSAEGKALGTLTARMPTIWRDSVFVPWDGVLPPEQDQEVSYKLSVPDWAALEKISGSSSFGQMFVLEIDVEIAGRATTLRSPQFERARPEIIKT